MAQDVCGWGEDIGEVEDKVEVEGLLWIMNAAESRKIIILRMRL